MNFALLTYDESLFQLLRMFYKINLIFFKLLKLIYLPFLTSTNAFMRDKHGSNSEVVL